MYGCLQVRPQEGNRVFQGPEDVLYDVFVNPKTKPVIEASGHICEGTLITLWVA
ncbi:MAG TPA: DUF3764 family protein [Prochlorococcus sp.]